MAGTIAAKHGCAEACAEQLRAAGVTVTGWDNVSGRVEIEYDGAFDTVETLAERCIDAALLAD